MKKLKKKELLWNLDHWAGMRKIPYDILTEQQSAEQIREIVELHFSNDWQQVKKDLGKFMQRQKPGVTEEWIEEIMKELFKKHTIGFPTPKAIEIFKELLKEAGIEVILS